VNSHQAPRHPGRVPRQWDYILAEARWRYCSWNYFAWTSMWEQFPSPRSKVSSRARRGSVSVQRKEAALPQHPLSHPSSWESRQGVSDPSHCLVERVCRYCDSRSAIHSIWDFLFPLHELAICSLMRPKHCYSTSASRGGNSFSMAGPGSLARECSDEQRQPKLS